MAKKEPLLTTPLPDYPWQMVGSDLFELAGEHFLLVVDYFSEIAKLASTILAAVITFLSQYSPDMGFWRSCTVTMVHSTHPKNFQCLWSYKGSNIPLVVQDTHKATGKLKGL